MAGDDEGPAKVPKQAKPDDPYVKQLAKHAQLLQENDTMKARITALENELAALKVAHAQEIQLAESKTELACQKASAAAIAAAYDKGKSDYEAALKAARSLLT